eukprot:gene12004-biopygen2173
MSPDQRASYRALQSKGPLAERRRGGAAGCLGSGLAQVRRRIRDQQRDAGRDAVPASEGACEARVDAAEGEQGGRGGSSGCRRSSPRGST